MRALVESFIISAGRSPIIAILGLGLVIATLVSGHQVLSLDWTQQSMLLAIIALGAIAVFELVRHVSARRAPLPIVPFIISSVLAGVIVRLLYVTLVQPEWYTDFERYWIYGVKLASGEIDQVTNVYAQRATFLTRPLIELFGPAPRSVPYGNVVILTVIQLIGYDIVRRTRGHQAAQGFSILWIATPIPVMTATVPNHDLAGLLLTATSVWLGTIAIKHADQPIGWRPAVLWACTGVTIALLEAARGIGSIYLISFVLMAGAAIAINGAANPIKCKAGKHSLLALGSTLVAFVAASSALSAAGTVMPRDVKELNIARYTMSHSNSLSDGTYNFHYAFTRAFTDELGNDTESVKRLRNAISMTDFVISPEERLHAVLSKMVRMYSLGSEQNFYLRGVEGRRLLATTSYNKMFAALFSVALLFSLVRWATHHPRKTAAESFLLLFTAITSTVLLLIGENQPRYLSVIWLTGAVVIPSQIALGKAGADNPQTSVTYLFLRSAGILLALLLALWFAISATSTEARGLLLHSWTPSTAGDSNDQDVFREIQARKSDVLIARNGRRMPTAFGELSLKLALPAGQDQASADTRVCGLQSGAQLRFFYYSPSIPRPMADLVLSVRANTDEIWSTSLESTPTPKHINVDLPSVIGDCARVSLQLTAGTPSDTPTFVEVFFARIEQ